MKRQSGEDHLHAEERDRNMSFPHSRHKRPTLLAPPSWPSSLQKCEVICLGCFVVAALASEHNVMKDKHALRENNGMDENYTYNGYV